MLCILICRVVCLLACASKIYCGRVTPPAARKRNDDGTKTVVHTVTSVLTKQNWPFETTPGAWNASKVEIIKESLFSPDVVIKILESYTELVQSPAIRSNYQLRGIKGTLTSPYRGMASGEFWTHRRWSSTPTNPEWFDGTLAEGLLDALNSTVNHHVPQLLSLDPEWDPRSSENTDDKFGRSNPFPPLQRNAQEAIRLLRAAAVGQSKDLIPTISKMVKMMVYRARTFAENLEEFDRLVFLCYRINGTGSAGDNAAEEISIIISGTGDLLSRVRAQATSQNSRRDDRKQQLEMQDMLVRLYKKNVLSFLLDDDVSTNGTTTRKEIHGAYENLRKGVEITSRDVESVVNGILIGSKDKLTEHLRKQSQENYDGKRWSARKMAKDLDKMTRLRQFASKIVAEATQVTTSIDELLKTRLTEAATLIARSEGLEPQGEGKPPARGTRREVYDPETGERHITQFLYDYQIRAPWRMSGEIRARADELEYVWSTIEWCEDELAYLNLCEAGDSDPEGKRASLTTRFRQHSAPGHEDAPPCDSFGNPLIAQHMCVDKY
ncbi:hypothetical protein F4781DRAFT_405568 [Annulohypoxylon bovei var. microspora]|nr:hypothetical protein F4781DRAFT_405568 [Annulohypoxylon bovei var. microspora]